MTENEAQKWLERFEWDDSEETSEALATICEALQEYPKFKAIGTIEEFKALKERNEPKSVKQFKKNGEFFGQCKVCERDVFINEKYCAICGQKLDWQ